MERTKLLPSAVLHDEARTDILDSSGRGKWRGLVDFMNKMPLNDSKAVEMPPRDVHSN
jgi:hypothetical protein